MTVHPYKLVVDKAFKRFGGYFKFDDIIEAIRSGDMQSFSKGDSWAVTQIGVFPQMRVLDVVFMVGTVPELMEIEKEIIQFAKDQGISLMMAHGRKGFIKKAFPGWNMVAATFIKEVDDG